LEECRSLEGGKTGEAKITRRYNLPAKFVIYTVGPVYRRGKSNEAEHLKNCYLNCLKLAFLAISTGAYGYPIEEATKIAVKTIREYLKNSEIAKGYLCCF
jgi:O-acetyl-ADP-ribose deacetylase (regulator of RNase III)